MLRVYQASLEFAGVFDSDNVANGMADEAPADANDASGGEIDDGGNVAPPRTPPEKTGKRYVMAEGERELQTGLLSKSGATYRVIVSGRIGVKEIERLIARLELDKDMLADDDLSDATEH